MKDAYPVIHELRSMVPDTHPNDSLVSSSLSRAETFVLRLDMLTAESCVKGTLETVQRVGASQDAQAALQLALTEIHRCM